MTVQDVTLSETPEAAPPRFSVWILSNAVVSRSFAPDRLR